ncbi:hypothetical protein O6H91_05G024800 [Diphasiastrum complanatum]|uniref:Uncharacterized protein n=1 Tax=Diphasiastrum complanatum TaxID=34168 RepID=A0ACC2DM16_DIPCM|nr:hypothetical protein O6H91_05G024800 [Diphasiastrum complanatum]
MCEVYISSDVALQPVGCCRWILQVQQSLCRTIAPCRSLLRMVIATDQGSTNAMTQREGTSHFMRVKHCKLDHCCRCYFQSFPENETGMAHSIPSNLTCALIPSDRFSTIHSQLIQ